MIDKTPRSLSDAGGMTRTAEVIQQEIEYNEGLMGRVSADYRKEEDREYRQDYFNRMGRIGDLLGRLRAELRRAKEASNAE